MSVFRCRNGFPVSFNLNLESIKLLPKSLFPLWPVTIKSWSQAPQLLSNTVKQEKPRLSLLARGMSSAVSSSHCWRTFSRQTLPNKTLKPGYCFFFFVAVSIFPLILRWKAGSWTSSSLELKPLACSWNLGQSLRLINLRKENIGWVHVLRSKPNKTRMYLNKWLLQRGCVRSIALSFLVFLMTDLERFSLQHQ